MTTTSQQRELREALCEINEELRSKLEELAELRNEIEALWEQKAWRVAALKG